MQKARVRKNAAVTIQSAGRGRIGRKQAKHVKHTKAATQIQARTHAHTHHAPLLIATLDLTACGDGLCRRRSEVAVRVTRGETNTNRPLESRYVSK